MTSRRSFVKNTALASTGAFIAPSFFKFDHHYIGLQLYTVRDAMGKDPKETLRKVGAIGYNSLEGATYTGTQTFYGMTPKEFAAELAKNHQVMRSSHYRLGADAKDQKGTMLNEWQKAVDDASTVGIKYMVCAFLSPAERGDIDHYKGFAEQLNKAGETCAKSGIQLCYHNHDFEFEPNHDMLPYDVILKNTDSKLVKMEIDLYWVTKAKHDPVALFNAHPGRFPLWHVKDMSKTDGSFAEVGSGTIDFKKIFKSAE